MSFAVIPTEKFQQDVRFYKNKRKYTHILDDLEEIMEQLENGEFPGSAIEDLHCNNKTYKVRVANSDTQSGKSNGYRLIYYAIVDDREIYLLSIYCKKHDNNVPTKTEIIDIINTYCCN